MSAAGKPDVLAVAAVDLDDDGAGVGAVGALELHVPDLVPGETATVAIVHRSPHRPLAWARIVERTSSPSVDRVTPVCPAFGRCGGCPWQHVAYPTQLVHKQHKVERAVEAAVLPPVAAPRSIHYRAKGKYVAGRNRGQLALGAWGRDRHVFVDTAGCQAVTPAIERTRAAVVDAAAAARLAPYDERLKVGHLRYAVIREAHDGVILVALVVRSDAAPAVVAAIGGALVERAAVAGVVRIDNDRDDGAILAAAPSVVAGRGVVDDVIAGVPIALGATEFAQVNPEQADAMYRHVATLAAVAPGEPAADVYAGLGGISFALARAGATVVAIERDAAAVASLGRAAHRAGIAVTGVVGDAARLGEHGDLGVVVVNPPRKGCGAATLAAITASRASRAIYVSCGPESLGRDLARLRADGWRVDHVQPFDLMPGTAQIETVVRLVR
jgi:23S rRNA (uracil1939-C5)-methyltransferase